MPGRKRTYAGARSNSAKRRRATIRRRRISRARPMRSLKTNYRATNVYRFCRETLPQTLSFSLIPAGSSFPAMGYLNFDNLQFNQLPEATSDFGNLFARYKVDKIVTYLTPLFQEAESNNASTARYDYSPNLKITRVNTKYLNEDFAVSANADDQLLQLAQFQSKSVTQYASKRSLKLETKRPGVRKKGILDSTGTEIDTRAPMPWLNASIETNVPLSHNSIIFAERIDGGGLNANWKYRVTHKIWFRCSQVS